MTNTDTPGEGLAGYCTDCENKTTIRNGRCGCGSGRVIGSDTAGLPSDRAGLVVDRFITGETVNGIPVLGWMWEKTVDGGPVRTTAYHWSTPPSNVKVTRLIDAEAIAAFSRAAEAVADERKAFEAWAACQYMAHPPHGAWTGWQARAALATPPAPQPIGSAREKQVRAETIEECAKVVEHSTLIRDWNVAHFIAKSLRALASKEGGDG